jgi:hypothetical protein
MGANVPFFNRKFSLNDFFSQKKSADGLPVINSWLSVTKSLSIISKYFVRFYFYTLLLLLITTNESKIKEYYTSFFELPGQSTTLH